MRDAFRAHKNFDKLPPHIKAHIMTARNINLVLIAPWRGLLGIDDSTGTIEPGKLADLLLVSGDPMLDLATLAHPELVMQGGRVYRPEKVSDE